LTDSGLTLVASSDRKPAPDAECPTCAGFGWEPTPQGSRRCHCLRDAIKARKLAAIPPKFAAFTLGTITPDAKRHAKQAALLDTMRAEPSASYVLCGRNGCGKTLFGWLLYRAAVEREMLASGVSCAELMRQFRAWEFDAEKLPIVTPADLRSDERRFVFIDELDKARPSEYAAEQLFELVDAAYSHDQQLVITSNTPLDGLAEHWSRNAATIGASIVRRLMDMSGAILVDMF